MNMKYQINRALRKNNPIILGYHSIDADDLEFPIWTHLSLTMFERHIKYLADNFRCISLSKLYTHLQRGEFEPYSVVITFDDGYRNNFTNAFPILMKYGIPATIFLTTNFIETDQFIWPDKLIAILIAADNPSISFGDKLFPIDTSAGKAIAYRYIVQHLKKLRPLEISRYLDGLMDRLNINGSMLTTPFLQSHFGHLIWEDVFLMLDSGLIEIGSHGMSHSILSRIALSEACQEIKQSKMTLDAKLKGFTSVRYFAYPNGGAGDYTQETKRLLIKAGYSAGLTMNPERIRKSTDLHELPRIGIGNGCDLESLRFHLSH